MSPRPATRKAWSTTDYPLKMLSYPSSFMSERTVVLSCHSDRSATFPSTTWRGSISKEGDTKMRQGGNPRFPLTTHLPNSSPYCPRTAIYCTMRAPLQPYQQIRSLNKTKHENLIDTGGRDSLASSLLPVGNTGNPQWVQIYGGGRRGRYRRAPRAIRGRQSQGDRFGGFDLDRYLWARIPGIFPDGGQPRHRP